MTTSMLSSDDDVPQFARLLAPSSPSRPCNDGEISPTFDISFASSMSISSDGLRQRSPISAPAKESTLLTSMSPSMSDMMEVSPAPTRQLPPISLVNSSPDPSASASASTSKATTVPDPFDSKSVKKSRPTRDYPFLQNIFKAAGTNENTSSARSKPVLKHAATVPCSEAEKLRRPFVSSIDMSSPSSFFASSRATLRDSTNQRTRPTTAPGEQLKPPAFPMSKRKTDSAVPLRTSLSERSSPVRMDIDGRSSPSDAFLAELMQPSHLSSDMRSKSDTRLPLTSNVVLEESPSDSALGEYFDSALSPIRCTRKRSLDTELSPTPSSPSSLRETIAPLQPRRPMERCATALGSYGPSASSSQTARRKTSMGNLNVNKRTSMGNMRSAAAAAAATTGETQITKRHAEQATDGKPTCPAKTFRRAFSVADAALPDVLGNRKALNDANQQRQSVAGEESLQKQARLDVKGPLSPNTSGSPLTSFRHMEEKGKSLPCFGVKDDGLMRITPQTLNALQSGAYVGTVARYVVVDCRFTYEYDGGHIEGAINLPTTVEVEQALLSVDGLPVPTTSEDPVPQGKTVLIFHCEFSAKRAPTSAKHLRSRDRSKNSGHYPRVHYPELYVLQGGYADFYKAFPDRCVGGYLPMDDPSHLAKRAVDLNAFRQSRQFQRASSFTFGQAQSMSRVLKASNLQNQRLAPAGFAFPPNKQSQPSGLQPPLVPKQAASVNKMAICSEEEHVEGGDSSFGASSGSSPGAAGDSPCPSNKVGRFSLKIGKESTPAATASGAATLGFAGRRRGLFERAQTSAILSFTSR